jgi:hypothetical protein
MQICSTKIFLHIFFPLTTAIFLQIQMMIRSLLGRVIIGSGRTAAVVNGKYPIEGPIEGYFKSSS